jgi:hypothetical protein
LTRNEKVITTFYDLSIECDELNQAHPDSGHDVLAQKLANMAGLLTNNKPHAAKKVLDALDEIDRDWVKHHLVKILAS